MISYVIQGFKWHDKININTYTKVWLGPTFWGDQWRFTAIEALIKLGLWRETDKFNHDSIRELLYFNCNENALKRDLNKLEVT